MHCFRQVHALDFVSGREHNSNEAMRLIKNPKKFLKAANPAKSPEIDKKFRVQPSRRKPEAMQRMFAAKAEALKRLREEYAAAPKHWVNLRSL